MRYFSLTAFVLTAVCCCLVRCSKPQRGGENTVYTQYYIKGESLYQLHCSNCHQKNGSGLGLLFPPLDTSDYMDNNFEEVICLLRHGKDGEIIVNGKKFNKEMSLSVRLSDLEIAQIATYIYNTWTHQRGMVDVSEASRILRDCPTE